VLTGLAVFLIAVAPVCLLFINVCNWVYQCGCQSWWAGAADACNIHHAQPPHCPWCLGGGWRGFVTFGTVALAQLGLAFGPGFGTFGRRLAAALLAFPVVGGALALLFGWTTGYWLP
jgi:hypothetical protein